MSALLALFVAGCGALVMPQTTIHATYSTHVTTPPVTPTASAPLYQSALTSASDHAGWVVDPVCQFTASGLVVKPAGGQAYICLAPAPATADVSVTVTVRQLSGSLDHAYGIAVRHNDPKSYYFFGVDGRGHFTLAVVLNDVSHSVIPFTSNGAIHAGSSASNTLQVIARGQQLTLLVNGVAVAQATLSNFASGTVGLRGINDGDVRFSALTVTPA